MNLSALLSEGLAGVVDLVKDVEKAVSTGGGIVAEGVDLVEVVIADADFRAHLSNLIAAIKA